ncbi:MAG TPA: metalloregulator ArsR/SmtB family transcription factor [Acidimicrobiia bacterium]|jgi:DNA-binding transcriptional ArsR family regulator
MARAATTTDPFNAIAEPRRRQILDLLIEGERPVSEIVAALPVSQPQVSKHLKVLKEVGLVKSRSEGKRRLYRVDAVALKPMHTWLERYEELWNQRLDRLDQYLNTLQTKEKEE